MAGTFLYPRTIYIQRPVEIGPTAAGAVGYQGTTEAAETMIYQDVTASIIASGSGYGYSAPRGGLPGDSPPIHWDIMLPAWANATLPIIQEQDVIYDDIGRRFQVIGFQPTQLGAKMICVRLKT